MLTSQYFISSSPLAPQNTKVASITYDVHVSPAKSGHGMFEGVCSIYLASREVGDRISCFVSGTNVNFCLPPALETPVILFAARTGIALMRAFLQKRATIASARDKDVTSGPTLLFYGYCHLDKDSLYKDEIREWEALGIVKAYHAYSNPGDNGDARVASSPRYVQDALWAHRDEVADLFHRGEKILLCGSASRLGQGCARVSKQIMRERTGKSDEEVEEWFRGVTNDRYISDVY